jgi:hypothetical protein
MPRRKFTINYNTFRRVERHVMTAAIMLGRTRPSDVVVKIREAIKRSEYPEAIDYTRGIVPIRQALSRYLNLICSIK